MRVYPFARFFVCGSPAVRSVYACTAIFAWPGYISSLPLPFIAVSRTWAGSSEFRILRVHACIVTGDQRRRDESVPMMIIRMTAEIVPPRMKPRADASVWS